MHKKPSKRLTVPPILVEYTKFVRQWILPESRQGAIAWCGIIATYCLVMWWLVA